MSKKGGYIILDLSGYDFTDGTAQTIAGTYEFFEANIGKPVQLSGVTIGSVEQPDVMLSWYMSNSVVTASVYGLTFTVDDDDAVKFD